MKILPITPVLNSGMNLRNRQFQSQANKYYPDPLESNKLQQEQNTPAVQRASHLVDVWA